MKNKQKVKPWTDVEYRLEQIMIYLRIMARDISYERDVDLMNALVELAAIYRKQWEEWEET